MNLPIAEAKSEIQPTSVLPLTDLIGYQDGSIVSRMIISDDGGNVTLFSFDNGQGLSEHTSPFDALVQVIDGEVEVTISGKGMTVKAGEIVRLPSGHPHKLKAVTRFKMLLTMIRS